MEQKMFHSPKLLVLISLVALMFCVEVRAQGNDRRRESRDAVASVRSAESSDLAKENLERVAASAAQLQGVLAKDPGILVELKRWVAKEASDNGQVVEDALLTDQAIFDRLEHDIAFRSVATRLVQHYGYLLPSVNPESEIVKKRNHWRPKKLSPSKKSQNRKLSAPIAIRASQGTATDLLRHEDHRETHFRMKRLYPNRCCQFYPNRYFHLIRRGL
jgi:hypothetical protein